MLTVTIFPSKLNSEEFFGEFNFLQHPLEKLILYILTMARLYHGIVKKLLYIETP